MITNGSPLWAILIVMFLILVVAPVLYLVDFILYKNVFDIIKNNKSFKVLRVLWLIFWVVPAFFMFFGNSIDSIRVDGVWFGGWGLLIMMLVLKIAMLIYGWVGVKDGIKRKWLLIAFFVPVIGSVLFLKKERAKKS